MKLERPYTRDVIKDFIHANTVAWVTFTKVDGTERKMKCTLNQSLIEWRGAAPNGKKVETVKKERPVNLNSLPVFDLQKDEWRSFIISQVTNVGLNA